MRVFIAVLVLIFSLQSWTRADDISDFEIEGMSIGDSALDHFDKSIILNNKMDYYKNEKFFTSTLSKIFKSNLYDGLQMSYQSNNFKIYEIEASIYFNNNNYECKQKSEKIFNEISSMFPEAKKTDWITKKLEYDASGLSTVTGRQLYFENSDYIQVACFDVSEVFEDRGFIDSLKVVLTTRKFADWRSKNIKHL